MQRGEKRGIFYIIKAIYIRLLQIIAYNSFPPSFTAFLHKLRGVKIGKRVFIGRNVYIDDMCPEMIEIGDEAFITAGTILLAHRRDIKNYKFECSAYDYNYYIGKISIGARSQIGVGSIIMPGVSLGEASIIGAGSVVTKDIPQGCLAMGVPAKIIKNFLE